MGSTLCSKQPFGTRVRVVRSGRSDGRSYWFRLGPNTGTAHLRFSYLPSARTRLQSDLGLRCCKRPKRSLAPSATSDKIGLHNRRSGFTTGMLAIDAKRQSTTSSSIMRRAASSILRVNSMSLALPTGTCAGTSFEGRGNKPEPRSKTRRNDAGSSCPIAWSNFSFEI